MNLINYILICLGGAALLMLLLMLMANNLFVRLVSLNCLTSYVIAFIVIISYFFDRTYLDLAIIYALISPIVMVFVEKHSNK
jgi:multisubunit Na+/H+ antiporter MnhF subunit